MASFAVHGDPNKARKKFTFPPTIEWLRPRIDGDAFAEVLDVGNLGFKRIRDDQTTADSGSHCDFILETAKAFTNQGGYAPPGSFMQSSIGRQVSETEASKNFDIPN